MRILITSLSLLLVSSALCGCASTNHNPKDPFESFNRKVYQFNDTVDKAVVKPVAKGYNVVVPVPAKMMLSNFFSNLHDVIVAVNDLLQFKLVHAISDTGRIAVNTTVGLYGLVDIASVVGLEKHDEDFGQTLGRWGLGIGPYLMLPLLGPSSVRDSVGLSVDSRTSLMRKVRHIDTRNEASAINLLGKRASLLDQESVLDEASIDRYTFIRDAYLQHRQSLVYDGNPPREKYDDEGDDRKSDRNSSTDSEPSGQFSAVETVPAAVATLPPALPIESPPATAASAPSAQKTLVVRRIWVTQNEGMH